MSVTMAAASAEA
jgi:hypothetical protein